MSGTFIVQDQLNLANYFPFLKKAFRDRIRDQPLLAAAN